MTSFMKKNNETEYSINYKNLCGEIILVLLLQLLFGIHNAILNVITIDSIISCIIFYMEYIIGEKDKLSEYYKINRLNTIDRYIYYCMVISIYYVITYISWFYFTFIIKYIVAMLISPSIMCYIFDNYIFITLCVYI